MIKWNNYQKRLDKVKQYKKKFGIIKRANKKPALKGDKGGCCQDYFFHNVLAFRRLGNSFLVIIVSISHVF